MPVPVAALALAAVVPWSADPAENCARIQEALDAKANVGRLVTPEPGRSFAISCKLLIGRGKSLYVAPETEIVLEGSSLVAVEVRGPGQLLGNGSLKVKAKESKAPRTGVLLTGSEGIVDFGEIRGFEYGVHLHGEGVGSAYNDVRVRKIMNPRQGVRLDATRGGWVNQNYIHISRIASDFGDSPPSDSYGVFIDSHTDHVPNANRFSGSIENLKNGVHLSGMYNRLDGLRLELPKGGLKLELDHTSWFNAECGGKRDAAKRCFPTASNWWIGEYGKLVPEKDIAASAAFLKLQTISGAVQAFGVEGFPTPAPASSSP